MKYIISGSNGLIGTFLKKELDKKHECILTIDKKNGFDINKLKFYEVFNTENKQKVTANIFIHLAAQCKINEAIEKPYLPHKNNTDGIFNVLEFCRNNNIPKIVVASSSRVLSKERNPYVASKVYTEELTKAYNECYNLEYVIIRPSTVYGPINDVTSRLMHDWCQNALKNKELPIYGNNKKTLDFTYISDFVDGTMLLIDNWERTKNQPYNISGNQETNLVTLAEMIIDGSKGGYIKFYPQEKAQPQLVNVDIDKIRKVGYVPKIGTEEGVKKMIEFYKEKNGK